MIHSLTTAAILVLAQATSEQDPCAGWRVEPAPFGNNEVVVEIERGLCLIVPPLPPHPCAIMRGEVDPPDRMPRPELVACAAIPADA